MRKIIFILISLLFIVNKVYASQEEDDQKMLEELGIGQEAQAAYKFPDIKPEAELMLGYRFVGVSGSKKAFEYEYLKDYPVFDGHLDFFKYPHRLRLDLDFNNNKDYQSDVNYAYGDLLLTRWFDTTFYHNLDNIELIDLDPSSLNYEVDIKDSDVRYGVITDIHNAMLRLKTPNFPAHLYLKILYVMKDGKFQQRSLSGSGYFDNIQRTTQERDIDWTTAIYEIGANSHLGHAEVELAHIDKRFDVGMDEALFDNYTANAFRSAGTFPHNQVSELKGSSNLINIHSNYNESLVASATFSIKERENEASGAKADIYQGAGSLQWTPLTRLSFFMNYSHIDVDADNPATASITDINGSVTTYPGSVIPSISKTTDTFSLTGRYNPETGVTLRAKYRYENIDRDKAADWGLQDTTRKNTFSLSAGLRVIKGFDLKTEYIHKAIVQPSYNNEPDYSDKGIASISWIPAAGINLLLNYSIAKEERDDLYFSETRNAKDRNTKTENLMGSGTFQLRNNLSLTTSYAFIRYKIRQDIVYGDVASTDNDVPYNEMAHVYSASLNYIPIDKLNIFALISQTKSTVEFIPGSQDLLNPVSIASFSKQKVTETTYRLSADYECMNSFSCSLEFQDNNVNDVLDNIHDDNQDGHAYIIMLSLKKKWL
ncbi:MAG: MtrB/PioB family outer membrane beta-barrel protein [Nitrospirae bacterium]|nr:MtrB/PioB family outer membrane beta-barrel protein [Nitrospirota bacterium]